MRNTADVTGGKPVAVLLQSISGVSTINPLVAFSPSIGEREMCYSFILSRTPRETFNIELSFLPRDRSIPFICRSIVYYYENECTDEKIFYWRDKHPRFRFAIYFRGKRNRVDTLSTLDLPHCGTSLCGNAIYKPSLYHNEAYFRRF
jgi:hypothetical protein